MSLQDSLGDRYTVIELIGEGGAGSVYKARDKVLDVFVAIKVMKQDEGGMAAARLQREAVAAGKLKHKNIAKIFDFGQTSDELPYMVMEYLPGDNLQSAIKNKSKLAMLEAVPIFIQICEGLGYAHKNGIVHRDLKPSNIVLMKDGQENRISKNPPVAKILDFGIASIGADQRLTAVGAVVGSPAYMSPEQIEISEITAQSDIYSFGCLMHETLSGHPPFEGASVLDTLQMHKNAQPERLSNENIDPDLADLVLDCLQKEPAQRPADTQVVKQRLEKILDAIRVKPQSESALLNPEDAVVLGAKKQNFISRFSNRTALVLSSVVLLGTAIYLSYAGARYLQTEPVSPQLKDDPNHTQSTRTADAPFYQGDDRFSLIRLNSNSYRAIGSFIKDEDLKDLDKSQVKNLRLEGKELTGSGIKYLKGAPIQHFELCGENLVDSELKYLADLPNLNSLCIESNSLGDEALKEVAKCKSIRFILLMDKKITNKGIAYLEPLKNLNTLKIQNAQIDNDVALELNKLKRLKQLNIGECRKLDKNFGVGLANLSLLQELSFECGCSKEAIRALKKLPLMQLGLQKCKLDRAALEELVTMQHLEALSLSSIKCKPSDYEVLAKLPKLSMLDLSDSKEFPDALYNAIAKTKIAELDLNRSKVTPAQFLKLARIETLAKAYCIDCPKLSQKDFSEFKDLHKILCRKTVQILGEAPDQTGN